MIERVLLGVLVAADTRAEIELGQGRGQRDVDVAVHVTGLDGRHAFLLRRAVARSRIAGTGLFGQHPDHREPQTADGYQLTHRVAVVEQFPFYLASKDADGAVVVSILLVYQSSLIRPEREQAEITVIDSHHLALGVAVAVLYLLVHHHLWRDVSDEGAHLLDVLRVVHREPHAVGPLGFHELLLAQGLRLDDDVAGTVLLDLPADLLPGAVADGEHGYHRRHPEDDPQHGQKGPYLLVKKAVYPDGDRRQYVHGATLSAPPV